MWSIDAALIEAWVASLDDGSRGQVFAAIEMLQEHGPQLGRPLVDTVTASRHRNMKELRPGSSGRSELRILFAFNPSGARFCSLPETRPVTGNVGTHRTSQWPTICSTSTCTG